MAPVLDFSSKADAEVQAEAVFASQVATVLSADEEDQTQKLFAVVGGERPRIAFFQQDDRFASLDAESQAVGAWLKSL